MNIKKYPNLNSRPLVDCIECGKRMEHHAKGLCDKCYKKHYQPKLIVCKECGRKRPHKAFGLCGGCHVRLYHYDKTRQYNFMKWHGISLDKIKEITKSCVVCGFSKIVELHHLDGDKRNKENGNIVGLCPNCHKMIHSYGFYHEIKKDLQKKGYNVSKIHPANYIYRRDEKKSAT